MNAITGRCRLIWNCSKFTCLVNAFGFAEIFDLFYSILSFFFWWNEGSSLRAFNDESFEICVDLGENEIFVFRFRWHLRMEGHDHTNPLSLFFPASDFPQLKPQTHSRTLFLFWISSSFLCWVELCTPWWWWWPTLPLFRRFIATPTRRDAHAKIAFLCARARLASFHLVKLTWWCGRFSIIGKDESNSDFSDFFPLENALGRLIFDSMFFLSKNVAACLPIPFWISFVSHYSLRKHTHIQEKRKKGATRISLFCFLSLFFFPPPLLFWRERVTFWSLTHGENTHGVHFSCTSFLCRWIRPSKTRPNPLARNHRCPAYN